MWIDAVELLLLRVTGKDMISVRIPFMEVVKGRRLRPARCSEGVIVSDL